MKVKSVPWLSVAVICFVLLALYTCEHLPPTLYTSQCVIARSDLDAIAQALKNFAEDHSGVYPANLSELFIQADGEKCYLKTKDTPLDPWRRKYIYAPSADRRAFKVVSYGSDGVPGGRDSAQDLSEDSNSAEH